MASFSVAVPLPQQLCMKLTKSLLLKNKIDLLFFLEHKLYGFPQSDTEISCSFKDTNTVLLKIDKKKLLENKNFIYTPLIRSTNKFHRVFLAEKKMKGTYYNNQIYSFFKRNLADRQYLSIVNS